MDEPDEDAAVDEGEANTTEIAQDWRTRQQEALLFS